MLNILKQLVALFGAIGALSKAWEQHKKKKQAKDIDKAIDEAIENKETKDLQKEIGKLIE